MTLNPFVEGVSHGPTAKSGTGVLQGPMKEVQP